MTACCLIVGSLAVFSLKYRTVWRQRVTHYALQQVNTNQSGLQLLFGQETTPSDLGNDEQQANSSEFQSDYLTKKKKRLFFFLLSETQEQKRISCERLDLCTWAACILQRDMSFLFTLKLSSSLSLKIYLLVHAHREMAPCRQADVWYVIMRLPESLNRVSFCHSSLCAMLCTKQLLALLKLGFITAPHIQETSTWFESIHSYGRN